ncbi:MAG: DNA mismatch repair endonuclease MutL, partial [Butyricicoccaceae bacterium]
RMKFLKKDATEGAYCENAVISAALANPGVSFKLIRDGRESFFSTGGGQLLQVIGALCPRETVASLLPIDGVFQGGEIHGYISPVGETRSSRSMQYFLVNGRPVRGKLLSSAIDGAYKGRIMPGRHPLCFLDIRVPLGAVDVNVHPAKLEVRFAREKDIFSLIHNAISAALDNASGFPEMDLPAAGSDAPAEPSAPADVQHADPWKQTVAVHRDGSGIPTAGEGKAAYGLALHAPAVQVRPVSPGFDLDESMFSINKMELVPPRKRPGAVPPFGVKDTVGAEEPAEVPEPPVPVPDQDAGNAEETVQQRMEGFAPDPAAAPESALPQVIGMAFGTYILAQQGEDLWVIDKHAAHEKLIYNRLRQQAGRMEAQLLLQPLSVSLTPAEKQACLDGAQLLAQCGFEVEDLGLPGLVVRGAPTYLQPADIPFVLSEMAGQLAGAGGAGSTVLDSLLASIACKAAIKGGSDSDMTELQRLAEQVLMLPDVRNCPHGRPVAVRMSRLQLEKQFKRVL